MRFAETGPGLAAGTFRRRLKQQAVFADDGRVMLAGNEFGGDLGMLTEHELAALRMMADGRRKAEIVEALQMTVRSFNHVCHSLYAKLGARTDVHAVSIGFRRGLISVDRRETEPASTPAAETADWTAEQMTELSLRAAERARNLAARAPSHQPGQPDTTL